MITKKNIQINGASKPIKLECSDRNTYFGDTAVTIYEDYKISLVLTDDCGAVIGDKVFFPKRGDAIIFRPNEVHFGRFPKSSRYTFISFFIPVDFFDTSFISSKDIISPFLDNSKDKVNLIQLPEGYKNKLIEISEELLEIMNDGAYIDIVAFAKLIEALNICNKFYNEQKNNAQEQTVPSLITKTIQKIDEQFPDFPGLNELAKACGCSVTYLTQTFRKYTGKTVYNYLTERRLEYARRMLKNGSSVTEACFQSGFSDCSGFIEQFKKRFGTTPYKYKKS